MGHCQLRHLRARLELRGTWIHSMHGMSWGALIWMSCLPQKGLRLLGVWTALTVSRAGSSSITTRHQRRGRRRYSLDLSVLLGMRQLWIVRIPPHLLIAVPNTPGCSASGTLVLSSLAIASRTFSLLTVLCAFCTATTAIKVSMSLSSPTFSFILVLSMSSMPLPAFPRAVVSPTSVPVVEVGHDLHSAKTQMRYTCPFHTDQSTAMS
mmetsp:Transcript_84686/g.203007  ORF Transcript_84686/g.203007 Transcript_84686/m.203007 type:complete len:208 (-) Transcript_84686:31-654(-)